MNAIRKVWKNAGRKERQIEGRKGIKKKKDIRMEATENERKIGRSKTRKMKKKGTFV